MATIAPSLGAAEHAEAIELRFFARIRKILAPSSAQRAPAAVGQTAELTFFGRLRKFLWLSSGLFSAASFAMPVIGFMAFGTFDGMGTNFLAAIVSGCFFGLASLLHFGPEVA